MSTLATDVIGDIAVVTVVAWLLGGAARRCGQPTAIGQILAGVLLGPSVLGRLPGHLTSHLFPRQVLPSLTALAQVAVVIFMFAVGYEIDVRALRGRRRVVPLLSGGALAVPMTLGIVSVLLLRSQFAAIGEPHDGRSFLLFIGVAMSITALPVLATIVRERGLAGTTAGTVATSAAGTMDVLAWLALAAALIGAGHGLRFSWPATLVLTASLVLVMLFGVRPTLDWWMNRRGSVLSNPIPMAFALALGIAWITANLGLQPVFGGLLAGVTMRPRNGTLDVDVLRSMDQAGGLLLPLFFIVTGLSLNVDSVGGAGFVLLAVVVVAATVGKLGPAYAISRACGLEPRQSATVAALLNTRGLTELIALNVGLDDGLINSRLFTILVLMALVTTLMTGPLLTAIRPAQARQPQPEATPAHGQETS